MKKALHWLLPLLLGFTLTPYVATQTSRVRWETWHQGAAYTTPVTEDQAFSNCFTSNGYATVGGVAYWRGDGLKCTWAVDGVGAGNMILDVYHDDGGVDCQCTVGACTDGPNAELACACPSQFQMNPNLTYCLKVDTTSSCATSEPGQWHCTMDLFR